MRPLPQIAALLALCLLLAGGPAGAAGGTRLLLPIVHSPALVVYESDRDSGLSLVEVQPDGSGRRTLSGPDANSWNPVPSPDGRHVAFFSTREGRNAAYVMARDGSGVRRLADCPICVRLAWSPDSRLLWLTTKELFTLAPDKVATVRIDLAGGAPVSLPADCQALAPDGSRCAFVAGTAGGSWEVLLRAPATAAPVRLAALPGPAYGLAWSRDGTLLAFSILEEGPDGVYVLGLDGRPPRRLADGDTLGWSPVADEILFRDREPGTLWIIGAQGGPARAVATGSFGPVAWSPDGAQLAYSGARGVLLLASSAGGAPVGVPTLKSVDGMVWSPDSGRLAVSASEGDGGARGLYLVGRAGGEPLRLGPGQGPAWLPGGGGLLFVVPVQAPHRLYLQSPGEVEGRPIAEGAWPDLGAGLVAFVRDGGLYTVGLDGAGERLLSGSLQVLAPPAWSPDGRRLAFAAKDGERASIYVAPREGGAPQPVAGCDGQLCGAPTWSPDGATLLFTIAQPDWPCTYAGQYGWCDRIVSVPAAGGERRELAVGGEPAWSPDGGRIAYLADGLYVMGAEGAGARRLVTCEPTFPGVSMARFCTAPAWSRDGRQLSYGMEIYAYRIQPTSNVYVVDAEGGAEAAALEGGLAPRWWGLGFAHIRIDRYALRESRYAVIYDTYQKLCLAEVPGGGCDLLPRGHGNVLMYDLAP